MFDDNKENNIKKSYFIKYGLLTFMLGHGFISELILSVNNITPSESFNLLLYVYKIRTTMLKASIIIILMIYVILLVSCLFGCEVEENRSDIFTSTNNRNAHSENYVHSNERLGSSCSCGVGSWVMLLVIILFILPVLTSFFGYLCSIGFSDDEMTKYFYFTEITAAFIHASSYSSYYLCNNSFDIYTIDN